MPFMTSGREIRKPKSFHLYSCCGSCEGSLGFPVSSQKAGLRDIGRGSRLEAPAGCPRICCVFAHVVSHGHEVTPLDDMRSTQNATGAGSSISRLQLLPERILAACGAAKDDVIYVTESVRS